MPRRIALLQSDWPASDCQAWAAALRQGDVFDEGGVASHWRAKTIAQAKSEHGRWLAFIQQHDLGALALVGENAPAKPCRPNTIKQRREVRPAGHTGISRNSG